MGRFGAWAVLVISPLILLLLFLCWGDRLQKSHFRLCNFVTVTFLGKAKDKKDKGHVSLLMELHLTAMGCPLPHGITQS